MAAFVPGFGSDVFISYAHSDDKRWVQLFEDELREEVSRRLGFTISVWKDTERLRAGENWQTAIEQGIARSAAFVAIISPHYANSLWCARERNEFKRLFLGNEFEASGRFFKSVRTPWPENGHRLFLGAIQDVDFYQEEDGGAREFSPGSREFRRAIRKLADGIEPLLRRMRRSSQRVHVAWPVEECILPWQQLSDELKSKGFDVQPTGPRDASFADKLLLQDMERAAVSIHLLGSAYDQFSERVALLAADLGHPLIFWTTSSADTSADARQRALLTAIRQGIRPDNPSREWPPGWSLISDASIRKLIDAALVKLRPQAPSPSPAATSGMPSVYIVHDATIAEDTRVALELRDRIGQREKMDVFVSRADFQSRTELKLWHENLLQTCDGVLLYRDRAPEGWWNQLAPEVILAEKRFSRGPIKSRAFLLQQPPPWEVGPDVKVIPYRSPFDISELDPFLVPLRQGADSSK